MLPENHVGFHCTLFSAHVYICPNASWLTCAMCNLYLLSQTTNVKVNLDKIALFIILFIFSFFRLNYKQNLKVSYFVV